jgi:UPF0042 nucleotide-binding protein
MKDSPKNRLFTIILTGLSGAGKTVALHAFEDSGFFCVDNLPASLIKTFVHLCYKTPTITETAIGVDIRERKFSAKLDQTIASLRKTQKLEIIFLEAKDDLLIRRYKETRRPHPLGFRDLKKAIQRERGILSDIRQVADRIIDTSELSPHQLRKMIVQLYSEKKEKPMTVSLISFGYKYGIPHEADLLFDARFLPNPNFVEELKRLNGTSSKVKKFIFSKKETGIFIDKLRSLLEFLIPKYKNEGRSYLTIGIGCTGGVHRSPAIVEEVEKIFKRQKLNISVTHRDIH